MNFRVFLKFPQRKPLILKSFFLFLFTHFQDEASPAPSKANVGALPAKPAPFRNEGKKKPASTGLMRQTTYPKKMNHSLVTSLKCKREEKKVGGKPVILFS